MTTTRTVLSTTNVPAPFPGTETEADENRRTHRYYSRDPDETPECDECCSKPWHESAKYPCGTNVPRVMRTIYFDGGRTYEPVTT